ncbi:MAG: phosphopantothenoylcysteine decarboxylase [Nitrospirae bacterium GWC2_56_14]|nr:MAG: phosphopantothenoylcysteine decarboxylase [Nitrospirae bacterium GWC2_56_14]
MMSGKRILLGVTGSIAAYKAVDILRRLQEQGAEVRVVMTRNACRFVSKLTFEALSGFPVLSDEYDPHEREGIGHIDVTSGLDLALIAPATANSIGKIASGIADDALTSALMAIDCPLMIAPAMNDRMYRNAVLRRNMASLRELSVRFIEPEVGKLACGTEGQGRLAETSTIVDAVSASFLPRDLAGVTVLVTAGPTREPIDAVRFISNPSTGKMGYALARVARDRGAKVILISGPVALTPPGGVTFIPVVSAADLHRAVMEQIGAAQVVVMAAAVSDFRPVAATDRKIKKEAAPATLALERTADILQELGALPGNRLLVGFAAETDDVLDNASRKLRAKQLDMIVVNDLLTNGAGFGSDTNVVTIIDRNGLTTHLPLMDKTEVAARVLDKVLELKAKQGNLP